MNSNIRTIALGELKVGTRFRFVGESREYAVAETDRGNGAVKIHDLANWIKFLGCYGVNTVRASEPVELVEAE